MELSREASSDAGAREESGVEGSKSREASAEERGIVFRKAALDQLASPEHIDKLLILTRPRDWVALAGILSLVGAAIFWGFFGRLTVTVEGHGILIRRGGVLDVVSLAAGPLTEVGVEVGDVVEKNQVVARIAQPELVKELEKARARRLELELQHQRLGNFGDEDARLRGERLARERSTADAAIAAARARVLALRTRLTNERQLVKSGLITGFEAARTKSELDAALLDVRLAEAKHQEAAVSALDQDRRRTADLEASQFAVSDAARAVERLEQRLESETRVISPYRGRVLELRANPGELVTLGAPILGLDPLDAESEGGAIEALVYVPTGEGKRIRAGMNVLISPSTARRERYGLLIGRVEFVAEFPATAKGMMRVLGNEELVRSFLQKSGGSVLTMRVTLVPDPSTPSRLKWSSGRGPEAPLTTGTPCEASTEIDRQAPVALVIPMLHGLID